MLIALLLILATTATAITIEKNPESSTSTIIQQGETIQKIESLSDKTEKLENALGDIPSKTEIEENFSVLENRIFSKIISSNSGVIGWLVVLLIANDLLIIGFFVYLRMKGLW